jgi:hypothetical protein
MPEEPNNTVTSETQTGRVEFVLPDPEGGLFTTYANNTQVSWTNFDVRMLFGEVVDNQPDKIVVEQRAQVTVSYLEAKLLILLLTQAVTRHEATFGEIKIPAEMLAINVRQTEAKVGTDTSVRK